MPEYTHVIPSNSKLKPGQALGLEKVFCLKKWSDVDVNLQTGTSKTCCKVPDRPVSGEELETMGISAIMNHPKETEHRKMILDGKVHQDCINCLDSEAKGMPSIRQDLDYLEGTKIIGNFTSPFDAPELLRKTENPIEKQKYLISHKAKSLDIMLGSACDLKCIYCCPVYSSQWAKESFNAGEITLDDYIKLVRFSNTEFQNVFWDWLDRIGKYTLNDINLLGGEPLYSPYFFKFLDKLMAIYTESPWKLDAKPRLSLVTNLNAKESVLNRAFRALEDLASVFDILIEPSIEAVGERAEFIRTNLSWERFDKNINTAARFIKKINANRKTHVLYLQVTLNALSVSSLPDFFSWMIQKGTDLDIQISPRMNCVTNPPFLNPSVLTPEFGEYVKKTLNILKGCPTIDLDDPKHMNILSHLKLLEISIAHRPPTQSLVVNELRGQFYRFFEDLKKKRGTELITIFPEYEDFFMLCKSSFLYGETVGKA